MNAIDPEQAITDASSNQGDKEYELVLQSLKNKSLYVTVSATPGHSASRLSIPTYDVASMKLIKLYTTRAHPDVGPQFGAIGWEVALEMVLSAPDLDGIKVVNGADDWVAYSKGALRLAREKGSGSTIIGV